MSRNDLSELTANPLIESNSPSAKSQITTRAMSIAHPEKRRNLNKKEVKLKSQPKNKNQNKTKP